MAENNNLGEYRVIVSADYSGLLAQIETTTKAVQEFANRINANMNAMTERINKSFAGLSSTMQQISQTSTTTSAAMRSLSADTVAVSVKNLGESFNGASGSGDKFTGILKRMKEHLGWIAAAGAIAAPFAAINSIAGIEQQMAGMVQVLPQLHNNQSALNGVSKEFIGIAEQYGMEVDKIIEAGKLWGRGYKDISEIMSLTGLNAKLAVADMMDVGLANRAVESVINSYGRQSDAVSFASHIVDSWTNVAHNAQSSATDLAEALMRSAAAAHVVGIDFDTTTALASTMIKTTGQQGGMIGNALKSIFSSIHSDKAIDDLQNLGISVYNFDKDGTAHFRNVASVITDLMLTVHETSHDMQKDLEHIAGGKFQWGRAAAMFGDYADFIKAYNLSINSSGFSEGQIAAQLDTINRKIAQVKDSLEGLLTNAGNAGLSQAIKGMLDAINNFLKGLQQIPASAYQVAGATAALGIGWFVLTRTLTFLNAGVIGLRTALASTVPAKAADIAVTGAETVALEADTVATNANAVAKGRLAAITTAATGGMNLILAALTAAAVGGSIYAASLGAAGNATQSAIQKNEDLIAAKKQELEMNQKQVEFIGTLGESYSKMQQSLIAVGDDEKKAVQIKKDMQVTEDELAKIVGKDAAERITHSEDINAAIAHEQEVHTEKGKNIQKSLDNIVTVQKQLRDDTINYCNDRIDAINNEAVAFDKAADAIEEALGRIDAAMYRFHENNAKEARAKADELQQSGADKSGAQILADATGWQPLKDIANSEFFKNRDAYYKNANQEAIEGLRGFAEKEEAAKQKISDRAKAFYSNKGAGAAGLGNHWYPSGDGSTVGGDETTPGGGGKGKGTGREHKGESAYTIAKRQYEEDISLANYSANEKLYLYNQYLANVEKSDKERLDFLKGQHSLDSETYKDSLKIQSDELEMQLAKRQISQEEYLQKQVELKRQSLDKELQTEIEHRKLSDQSAGRHQQSDDAYKTEIQGTAWYIAALKESYNVEKKLSDYQIDLAKKVADYHQQIALDEISAEEKKYQTMYDRGQINEQQLLTLQSDLENQRFKIQSDGLNKALLATLNDTSEMRAGYADYINSTTDEERNAAAEKLINLTKNKTDTLQALKELETAYSQHADKVKSIDNSMWKELNKNILEAKNSMTDALSQAFQDNLNGATSFVESLGNIIKSVGKTIEKQLTDAMAKNFTDKAFSKSLNGNNTTGKANSEKQSQAQITAQAAAGAAARLAIEQATAQQQTTITQQKATTQKALEVTKDQVITGSAQAMGQTVVSSIQDSIDAMLQMLPTMLLISALGSLFGGGGSSKSTSTSSVSLGRSPSSYYATPSGVSTVPSFDVGAFELPSDMYAKVHKGESIIPKPFADDFRKAVSSNSGSGSFDGRPIIVKSNFAPNVIDSRGIDKMFKQNMKEMSKTIVRAGRYGTLNKNSLK